MRAFVRARCDAPDAAAVAGFAARKYSTWGVMHVVSFVPAKLVVAHPTGLNCWLFHRLAIIEIPRRLRQQEHILVRLGAAIRYALWHRVRLVPDDILPEIPAIGAQGECQHPRNADQVFVLQPNGRRIAMRSAALLAAHAVERALVSLAADAAGDCLRWHVRAAALASTT